MSISLVEPEDVLGKVVGRKVLQWNLDDDGLYLELDDGTSLVFIGQFAISVIGCDETLQ
jgi:hypothetical protein